MRVDEKNFVPRSRHAARGLSALENFSSSATQTTSSSISQQAAARTRQSRYGSMSRQSSSRRSIANLVNGSPRRSSSTLANGAAEGEMIDPDALV